MNRLLWIAAGVVLAVGAWACGSNVCDRSASQSQALATKWAPCDDPDSGIKITFSFDKTACQARESNCTSSDLSTIGTYQDCVDKVGTCVKGQENAWFSALTQCSNGASGISAACRGDAGF